MNTQLATGAEPIFPARSYEDILDETIEYMEALGTYKPSYSQAIQIYARMVHEYESLMSEYVYQSGGEERYMYSQPTENGGVKRSPVSSQLSDLRKQINVYATALMLTPRSERDAKNGKAPEEKKKTLEDILAGLEV